MSNVITEKLDSIYQFEAPNDLYSIFGDDLFQYENLSESIGDILSKELGLDKDILTEGIFDLPVNKVKSMIKNFQTNDPEKLKKATNRFKSSAEKVGVKKIEDSAYNLSRSINIDDKEVASTFTKITRAIAVFQIGMFTTINPLGWALVIIAIIMCIAKKKPLSEFGDEIVKRIGDGANHIKKDDTTIEKAIALMSIGNRLMLYCFIPPFLQVIILLPIAMICSWVGLILFWAGVFQTIKDVKSDTEVKEK